MKLEEETDKEQPPCRVKPPVSVFLMRETNATGSSRIGGEKRRGASKKRQQQRYLMKVQGRHDQVTNVLQ
jgi:hypothetical protein